MTGHDEFAMPQLRGQDSFRGLASAVLPLLCIVLYLAAAVPAGRCPDVVAQDAAHQSSGHHSSSQQTVHHLLCGWGCQAGVGVGLAVDAPTVPVLLALVFVFPWTIRSYRSGSSSCAAVRGPPLFSSLS